MHRVSHTPCLSNAIAPFRVVPDGSDMGRPAHDLTLIGADDVSMVGGARSVAGLAGQVDSTVDWAGALEAVLKRRIDRIFEPGPGMALADMVQVLDPMLGDHAGDDF